MKTEKKTVAIIGGGYTGLAAAHKLTKQGFAVTIFERESKVGGLAVGFDMAGLNLEKIWHFLYKSDSEVLAMAKELGVLDALVFHKSSIATYYGGKLYSFMSAIDLIKFTPISFISRIRTGLAAFYLQRLNNWQPLTKITALEWMQKWSGKDAAKVIWEPLLKGKFGSYYDKVLMSWLWKRIRVRVDSNEGGDEMLAYFKGGFSVLTNALEAAIIKNGGIIKTNTSVTAITKKTNGKSLVVMGESKQEFDFVLATTPTHVFAQLIKDNSNVTNTYLEELKSIDYVGALVMVIVSDQKISDYYWHNVNDDAIPFLAFLAYGELVGTKEFNGKHVYYVGYYAEHDHPYFETDNSQIMQEWTNGIKEMFPNFDEEQVIAQNIFKFKNAQHIVDDGYEARIPAYESPLEGVYLGNFSQIYPDDRGLNYAVLEGYKIADMIVTKSNK